MNYDPEIKGLITELIEHTRFLVAVLTADVDHLKANNLAGLEGNNDKKYSINNKLTELIHRLQHHPALMPYSGSLNEKLLHCARLLSPKERSELEDLLDTMTAEIRVYNQMMLVNRQVLNSNLAFIKDLFFTLLVNNQEELPSTYNRTGVLETL